EANAEDYWDVPQWETSEQNETPEKESPFAAAYEGVTYRDTADDDTEGAVADGGGPPPDLDFDREADRVGQRLRFVSTVARLWQIAAWRGASLGRTSAFEEALRPWLAVAIDHQEKLSELLESIYDHPIPEPMGSYDSMVEYDRRRLLKEHLLHTAVATGLDVYLSAVAARGALGAKEEMGREGEEAVKPKTEDRGSKIEDRPDDDQSSILDPRSSNASSPHRPLPPSPAW